ncbi:histone-lysine N-methyltransferase set-1-like isoform X3 [Pseudorasbora parva]|uniref:histone-lysine N-methyltransferase set-1-like isoform X3 n=1 Tax=Pseudorasbora parva TaxID=51549 RepID=UPI00351E4922
MSKRKRISPEEDATAHILSGEDKPCFEERFIYSNKGRGVFARMSIDKGCFILEYRGELLSQEESQTRQNIYTDSENAFLFDFNWGGRQWCIDASEEDGSLGRLVNDNHKTPNCKVKKIVIEGKPHLCLFSVKDIAPGEELTYNYGDANPPWRTRVTRAVPSSEENTPSQEGSCLLTKINSPKPTEQVPSMFAAQVKDHHDSYAQCYEELSKLTLESEGGATDHRMIYLRLSESTYG